MTCGSMSMVLGVVLAAGMARGEEDTVLQARIEECAQNADGDCLERLAAFEEAATAFEQHDLLAAIRLRRELGQAELAYADALEFLHRFSHDPHVGEVAREALLVGGMFEAVSDEEKSANLYERYLRDFDKLGGWDGFVIAHAKLGALTMRASCSIPGYLGACVEITRVRTECPPKWNEDMWSREQRESGPRLFWGEAAKPHEREPGKLREAKRHLRKALDKAALKKAELDAAGSPARLRSLANARGEAMRLLASVEWDAYLALGEIPWGLDFTQPSPSDEPCEARRKKATIERSSKAFMRYLTDLTKGFERLRKQYKKSILLGGPESSLAATARFAMVASRAEHALGGGGWTAPECDRFDAVDKLSPIEDDVVSASERCARLAATFGIGDDWADYCRWELQRHKPSDHPPLVELSPDSVFMSHARDDQAYRPVEIEKDDSPPRLRPQPVKRRCSARKVPDKQEDEGRYLSSIFGRDTDTKERLAYPDDFLAKLTARFSPPWSR